ncbi:MAG: lysostaphin resistance A-like protein [Bacteroidales bacterium]
MMKGVFVNYSSMKKILVLVILMLVGLCLAAVLTSLLMGQNIEQTNEIRLVQLLTLTGLFIFPSFFGAYLFSDDWKHYLYLDRKVKKDQIGYTVILILCLQPFLNWMVYLNNQIVFPEFLSGLEVVLRTMEDSAQKNIELMLTTNSIIVCLINILLIAVLTAIGEEAFFRGILQRMMLEQTKRAWVAILVIAIVFSAIHFQFYGFFARMFLGVLLGYLVYASKSLLLPIVAHAANNTIGILQIYFNHKYDVDNLTDLPPRGIIVLFSVFISVFFLRLLIRSFRRERITE